MTRVIAVCAAVALAVAILPWPYAYYQVLRIGIFAAGVYCGIAARSAGGEKLAYGLWFAAALFNPFLPVHLTREIWMVLNLVGAALFAYTAYRPPSDKLAFNSDRSDGDQAPESR